MNALVWLFWGMAMLIGCYISFRITKSYYQGIIGELEEQNTELRNQLHKLQQKHY